MRALLVPAPSIARDVGHIASALRAAGVDLAIGTASDLDAPEISQFEVIAGPGSLPCDAPLIARCPRLRRLVSIGGGCEGFDRAAAAAWSIEIATGATRENVDGMASAAIMLMLALLHDLPGAQRACAGGTRRDTSRAHALDGAQVGLIGFGAIGREVARRLRAWNVTVVAFAPSLPRGLLLDNGAVSVDLEHLLRTSDVVSLHAALNPSSRRLLDRERIALMKRGAILLNTARGGLVDEAALLDALDADRLAAAALDCFDIEPLPADSPLRMSQKLILTPHQIGHTRQGEASIIEALIANIVRPLPRR